MGLLKNQILIMKKLGFLLALIALVALGYYFQKDNKGIVDTKPSQVESLPENNTIASNKSDLETSLLHLLYQNVLAIIKMNILINEICRG